MSNTEKLIDLILSMTPEQFEKFLNHPEVIEIISSAEEKETATT